MAGMWRIGQFFAGGAAVLPYLGEVFPNPKVAGQHLLLSKTISQDHPDMLKSEILDSEATT